MPLPTLDPGIANLAAAMPCTTRRQMLKIDPTAAATYGWFPWKGQYIDTPPRVATKWTSDDDTRPLV